MILHETHIIPIGNSDNAGSVDESELSGIDAESDNGSESDSVLQSKKAIAQANKRARKAEKKDTNIQRQKKPRGQSANIDDYRQGGTTGPNSASSSSSSSSFVDIGTYNNTNRATTSYANTGGSASSSSSSTTGHNSMSANKATAEQHSRPATKGSDDFFDTGIMCSVRINYMID